MSNLGYLFTAYTIVWLGLLAYVFIVAGTIGQLRKSVQALRDLLAAQESAQGRPGLERPGADATEPAPRP